MAGDGESSRFSGRSPWFFLLPPLWLQLLIGGPLVLIGIIFAISFWQSFVFFGLAVIFIALYGSKKRRYTSPFLYIGLACLFLGLLPILGVEPDIFWPLVCACMITMMMVMLLRPLIERAYMGAVGMLGIVLILCAMFFGVFFLLGPQFTITQMNAITGQSTQVSLYQVLENLGRGLHVMCVDCTAEIAAGGVGLILIIVTAWLVTASMLRGKY